MNIGQKILLVEDELITHKAICKAFKDYNYNYTGVTTLADAISYIKRFQFDIIFSDLNLPDGSGFDLLDEAKKILLDIPFIIITASEDKKLIKDAMNKGASDFLSKPFNLQNIPTIISRNIERKRLENEKLNPKKASALLKAIKALVSALEAKDSYTSGHSLRVAHYARLMGQKMNLSENDQYCLHLSAILHDIGKIGLPDDILKKGSGLLQSEYDTAKEHPLIGSKIVGNIDELHEVASIIRHHHERFDGSGYPDRLTGEGIPLLARILAIVDAYEAIVSIRTYQGEQSPAKAIMELRKNSGSQFDPDLVEIFSSLMQEPDFFHYNAVAI
jgi:putative nucleotidyltransferase with HDIG domain